MLPILAFLGFMGLLYAAAVHLPPIRFRRSVPPARTVTIDEQGVRRELPSGEREGVPWAELVRVEIVTTSDGPFAEDLFWVLWGADGSGCAVPGGEAGSLAGRVHSLPGVDFIQAIAAMGSTTEARFLVWSGERGQGLAAATTAPSERIDTLGDAR